MIIQVLHCPHCQGTPIVRHGKSPEGKQCYRSEAIDAEVLQIISESHDEAKRLLSEHRQQLDALVDALLEQEILNEQEIIEVTGLPPAPPLETERCLSLRRSAGSTSRNGS